MMQLALTFNDIFKSSFLEQVDSFAPLDMVIALALAFALGLFILLIYRKTFSGVMYSASFGLSLMALTLITTLVIMAVTSNVVLSLGMVGALSIVRFRAAIKEPMDIAFLFWAIAAGIVLGAGLLPLAVFGSLFIGIILLVFANRRGGMGGMNGGFGNRGQGGMADGFGGVSSGSGNSALLAAVFAGAVVCVAVAWFWPRRRMHRGSGARRSRREG